MAKPKPASRPTARPRRGSSAYRDLETRFRRLATLGETISVLHWDTAVMMPAGGAAARAEQVAALKVLRHELLTDPALEGALAAAAGEVAADRSPGAEWRAANVREMRRSYVHAVGVPSDLLEVHSKACAACEMAWRDARPANDFAAAAPALAEVLRLSREGRGSEGKGARRKFGRFFTSVPHCFFRSP